MATLEESVIVEQVLPAVSLGALANGTATTATGEIHTPGTVTPLPFTCEGSVVFNSERDAHMVCQALSVDPELRPQEVRRRLTVHGSRLDMYFEAVDARLLRASVCTFCDLMGLATRTLEAFGAPEESAAPAV
eukprot:jgi/Botrbrau1/8355/Bobra.0046s0016.1